MEINFFINNNVSPDKHAFCVYLGMKDTKVRQSCKFNRQECNLYTICEIKSAHRSKVSLKPDKVGHTVRTVSPNDIGSVPNQPQGLKGQLKHYNQYKQRYTYNFHTGYILSVHLGSTKKSILYIHYTSVNNKSSTNKKKSHKSRETFR